MYGHFRFYHVYRWYYHYHLKGPQYFFIDVIILLFVWFFVSTMVRSSKTRISLERSLSDSQDGNRNYTSFSPVSSFINNTSQDHINSESKQRRKESGEPSFIMDYSPPKIHPKKSWKILNPYSKRVLMHFVRRAKKWESYIVIIFSSCLLSVPDKRKEDILNLYNHAITSSLNIIDVVYFWNYINRQKYFPNLHIRLI